MKLLIKYFPKISEKFLNDKAILELKNFILNFGKKKACLIYGESGVGKSASVYVLANELGLEVLEINASDHRNAEKIESIIGNASRQGSLFGNGKLIFIDEIDGLSGTKDRGGLSSLIKVIESSSFPIILSCNEINEKLEPISKKSLVVEFPKIEDEKLIGFLENICKKERISYDLKDLKKFVRMHNGDVRKLLMNFESLVENKKFVFDDKSVVFPENKEEMDNFLVKLFRVKDLKTCFSASDDLNNDFFDFSKGRSPVIFSNDDAVVYWIEENLPREYSSLEESFEFLSKADVFLGRIRKQQHWRLLVYSKCLSLGVNVVSEKGEGKVNFKKTRRSPKNNFRLWGLVNKRKRIVSEKIGLKTHVSSSRAMKEYLPYFKRIVRGNEVKLIDEFDFSKDEIEWLKK